MPHSQPLPLLLLLLLGSSATTVAGLGFCRPTQTTQPQPPALSDVFQAKMEMKDVVNNKTSDIELWHHYDMKLSRLYIEQEMNKMDLYYSFTTQEIFYVDRSTLQCMVFNMSTGGDLDNIIGQNVSGVITPDTTRTLLRLDPAFGIEYVPGQYTVRGIQSNRWRSCQSWPERGAEFEVNWYFSDPKWDSVNSMSTPLRIEVEGWSNRSATPNRPFKQVYDFVFFRPYLEDRETVFQTPRGAFCANRIKTKKIPQLSPILVFTSEKTIGRTERIESVSYGKMHYDTTQNIVAYETREPGSIMKPPFYNMGSLTLVQDFNSGVAYFVDNVLGNCSAVPIGAWLNDVEDIGSAGWHAFLMKDPMKLFYLDDTYQYEGQAMRRGLPVDVFISLREVPLQGSLTNLTFEYYILQDTVTEIMVGPGKIGFGHSVPVELNMVSYTELGPDVDPGFSYFQRVNFFNFDAAVADSSEGIDTEQVQAYNYDIGSCYSNERRTNFLLKMKPEEADLPVESAMNETHEFIRRAVKVLEDTEMGLVNPIRFQHPRLDTDGKFLYLLVTLLDKPDVYSMFSKVSTPNQIVLSVDASFTAATERECLEACYSSVEAGCSSVAFCHGANVPTKNCLTSRVYGFKNNENGYVCDAFVRPSNASSRLRELGLEEAWNNIQDMATAGQIRVPITLPGKARKHYKSVSAEIADVRLDVYNPLSGRHVKQFDRLQKSSMKTWKRQVESRVSADDCALACLEETEFECKSATYCYDLGVCRIADKAPADVPDSEIVARARCDVFSVNPLSKYTESPGVSRVRTLGILPAGNGSSPVACASLCTAAGAGNSSSACRSFDACLATGQQRHRLQSDATVLCYLSAGHSTDGGGRGTNASDCTHYSKSFVADFVADLVVTNPRIDHMLVKASVTLDQCARLCAEEFTNDCQGVYYCTDAECAIRGVGVAAAQQGTQAGGRDVRCQYWKRQYMPDGSPYKASRPQTGDAANKGVSAPVATVIYILCSLVGVVLGPAVLLAVMHACGKSAWRDFKALVTWR